jgi:drug/metabolite transporter superfamily protein YnfA
VLRVSKQKKRRQLALDLKCGAWQLLRREVLRLPLVAWLIFIVAAVLEVAGDAVIRKGLHGSGIALISGGFVMLGCYGLVVNTLRWDFSRLLGVYVAVFAVVSVPAGRFAFGETVPAPTWIGLGIIVAGGLVIQFGAKFKW